MKIVDWRERLLLSCNRFPQPAPTRPVSLQILDDRFFEKGWGKQAAVLPWDLGDAPWLELFETLCSKLPGASILRVIEGGKRMVGSCSLPLEQVDSQLVVLRDVHAMVPVLAELQRSFSAFFRCPVTSGLYLNGPGAPGFGEHHDAHHVFAFQLVGQKTWELGPPQVRWPTRRFLHSVTESGVRTHRVIDAGRMLYLPPGVRHRARCTGSVSMHFTLGVHAPRVQDALECLLDQAASSDANLRAPLRCVRSPGGLSWELDREALGARLHHLADRLGVRDPQLPEGTPLGFVNPAITGAWKVEHGCFVVHPHRGSEIAQRGADRLMQIPGVEAVYLRGSTLDADVHAQDIDLLVPCSTPVDPAVLRDALAEISPVSWEARPVDLDAVRQGRASPWVTLCLAVQAHRIAGEAVWDTPPVVLPSAALARALRAESVRAWERVGGTGSTRWYQKRALRLLGTIGLERIGVYTRHPTGCVELAHHLMPELADRATQVRHDLFTNRTSPEGRERALALGRCLMESETGA